MQLRSDLQRRREGAVMIEAIMVASMFVLLLGAITLMHRHALAAIEVQQQARNEAYARAFAGCVDNEISLAEAAGALRDGELPIPSGMTGGGSAEASATRSVLGLFGRGTLSATSAARMPCNTRSASASASEAGAWLMDLF